MTSIRKIRFSVEETSTDTVRIMATGSIELGPTGRLVAANVNRLREARGMTLRSLAERLKDLGRPLSADALNKIENGRLVGGGEGKRRSIRRVDADDLVALSIALGVNVSALLLPLTDDPAQSVEITGAGTVTADVAWAWASNRRPLRLPENPGDADTAMREYEIYSIPPRMRSPRRWLPGERSPEMLANIREGVDRLVEWGAVDPDTIKRLDPEAWKDGD